MDQVGVRAEREGVPSPGVDAPRTAGTPRRAARRQTRLMPLGMAPSRESELCSPEAVTPAWSGGGPRVVLYSHDTMGLGHARRNLLIAQALAEPPLYASVLCLSGIAEAHGWPMPPRVDWLTLPALSKRSDGSYGARRLPMTLEALLALRSETILAAVQSFDPDVLVVDKVARGALGELDPALQHLRRLGRTRCILGLRDILDSPAAVHAEWRRERTLEAIRDYYDAVWVYGDAAVYNPVSEYAWPEVVAARVRFTGYLDQRSRLTLLSEGDDGLPDGFLPPESRLAVCLTGGGQDGVRLAESFARAQMPTGMLGVVVAGPMMPEPARRRLHRLCASRPALRLLDALPEPGVLVRRAERVVAMGGYNTACEILSHGPRALIVPRERPRKEQQIRAEHLRRLDLVDTLSPSELSPAALGAWLARDLPPPSPTAGRVDLGGLSRLPGLLLEVLASHVAGSDRMREVGHVS